MTIPRRITGTVIATLGALLALTHATHIITHDKPPVALLIGAGIPLLISAIIIYAGYWTTQQHYPTRSQKRLLAWTIIGGAAIGGLVGTITLHQYLAGDTPDAAEFQIATAITGGILAGFLAGIYNTEVHRRSTRLEALQTATAEFVTAPGKEAVCERCVEFAETELNASLAGAWLYNEAQNALEPVAATDAGNDTFGTAPKYTPGDSLSWDAFTDGGVRVYDDVHDHPDRHNPDTVIRSELIIPIGDYGVMNIGSRDPAAFDDVDVAPARILASITESVLDRVEREAELREQRQQLEQQNERLEEFASIVSHDLRNPLSVAEGYVELIEDDCNPDAVEHIKNAHQRMETLITDMLHLARAGQTIEDTALVILSDVANAAWDMVETPDTATLTITTDADGFVVTGDESRLRQLFENLFRNTVEHSGEDVAVTIGALDDSDGFYIADDGPGIPVEDRDRVFDSGYTTSEDGSGLGLVTVQRIVDAHGWDVSITESSDGGARFEIHVEKNERESRDDERE
jgi:signal transduction histidine kinase